MKKGLIEEIIRLASKSPYFTIHDVKRILRNKKYAYLALNILVKRGEIFRLAKGFYSKHDDPSLIVFYFKPAYLGLQDAMSYLNLWEQETASIVITVKRVRCGTRKILGNNVIVKRINPRYFFGFEFLKVGKFYLPVSNVEKTFVDLIYFNEWRRDYGKYFRGKIDFKILEKYAENYPERVKERIVKISKRLK